MSSRSPQRVVSVFASRTAFEALAVESGEESEEEQLAEEEPAAAGPQEEKDPVPTESASAGQPLKMTKTAQKKAARLARQQLKQEKKDRRSRSTGSGTEEQTSGRDTPPLSAVSNSVEIPLEVESDASAVLVEKPEEPQPEPAAPAAVPESDSVVNGGVSHDIAPAPTVPASPPGVSSKPSAFPTSPVDIAMRQASQSLAVNPLSRKSDIVEIQRSGPSTVQADPEKSVRDAESVKKRQSFFERTLWTLIMIGGFILCLGAGHAYMIMLVMVIQTLVYREVTALFSLGAPKSKADDEANGKDPWSKTLNWYFFVVANFFFYGESIIYYFKHVVFSDWHFSLFAANHRFTSFSLYTIGFVGFVYSLQRQHLKSQFGLFCWVHMSLLVIVVSSHFIMNNILEGLIWFWVPASLVICNDIFAYIWGITMGRTPLFKLSPKKTVEGFVGAFFSTILFGQVWGTLFMRSKYMICPAHDLGVNFFSYNTCTPNPVFVWHAWELPVPLRVLLSALPIPGLGDVSSVPYAPYQFHLLVMSCFASLVAPFGGFFASGFKRAFDIKDFGHSIPGHGGMTDRMDCQFLMGVFTYVYYSSLVKEHNVTVGHILQLIVSGLTLDEQIELMSDFKRYLEGRGIGF